MNQRSLSAHIETLAEKHEVLDKEIAACLQHEVYNDTEISELKRRKLLLKDEIAQCKARLKSHI